MKHLNRRNFLGGVIAAASRRDALPMLHIGSIPIISRLVITFQQAGIDDGYLDEIRKGDKFSVEGAK